MTNALPPKWTEQLGLVDAKRLTALAQIYSLASNAKDCAIELADYELAAAARNVCASAAASKPETGATP